LAVEFERESRIAAIATKGSQGPSSTLPNDQLYCALEGISLPEPLITHDTST
jgi:hypothetical protein